jgi:hypothetical protein
MAMLTAVGVEVAVGWGVGLGGVDVGVARGTTDVVLVGVGECTRPISNVPLQDVITSRKRTADKMRDFMGPPDLVWIYPLF